ncbi:MAG: hypothetical protein ACJ77A_11230 [Actinomycetota bacterium]
MAAINAVAALILLATACTASPASTGGLSHAEGSTTSRSAVAFSACMRSHGVPNYPDPDSSGQLPKPDARHLGVSSSQLRAAQQACQHVLPNSGGAINTDSIQQCMLADDCPRALVQRVRNEELNFARCMRSHGVPNWPDPIIDSQGRPVFAISISKDGFDPYSSQVWAKGNECSHLMPGLPGLPAAVSP